MLRVSCMRITMLFVTIAALLLVAGEATDVTYQQWNWNLKGDILVIATGSLRYHGPNPIVPDVYDPAGCKSACADIAGCNGWTFCNSKSGCGTGCKDYLSQNPALEGEDPTKTGRQALPLNTPLSALKRPGPYEGLCDYKDNNKWLFGTCTLKVVPNPQQPEFWTKNPADGWVSGSLTIPSDCGRGIPPRTCSKCQKLGAPKTAQCVSCAKNISSKGTPLPVMRTLLDNAPITTDGCAMCYGLKAPSACLGCLNSNKKCATCALQGAEPGRFSAAPPGFDAGVCVTCATANGAGSTDACLQCAAAKTAASKSKCVSCVAGQKSRFCLDGQSTNGCIPPEICKACAENVPDMRTCTDCMARKPYNPDCLPCADNTDLVKQKTCFDCAKKVQNYAGSRTGACSQCVSLDTALKTQDCIKNCALRADLAASVPRVWCRWCTDDVGQVEWNKCYDCMVKNPNNLELCRN